MRCQQHIWSAGEALQASTFVINKDDQCGDQNGYYQFEVIGGELHLSAVKDLCTPRIDAISGSWSRL
ncbi:MAG: hypothetical protein PF694_04815 [Bacteroidetes bacterium]|nr:hypothetical protein [Bacteroidota bacterium]